MRGDTVTDWPYFDELGIAREVTFWAVATFEQLDVWEAELHRRVCASLWTDESDDPGSVWKQARSHHLAFVSAWNTIRGIDLAAKNLPPTHALADLLAVSTEIRPALNAMRNVLEHWDDHKPVFNQRPMPTTPVRAGKQLYELNESASPFTGGGWNNHDGAYLLRNLVTMAEVLAWLDHVTSITTEVVPTLARFLPGPRPVRWATDKSGQWPIPNPAGSG